ncbi:hypothetical protein O6H91_Y153800 [Diphasiastrum complanatum]|nr:hypothetical protein O6H91_Y153800 [Diphasiastrum complanatum]KAJ7299787.1 hypothetical protein O6H91_Y153800 [Diphasiastrum complanatum]
MVTTETSHASHTNQEGVQRGREINSEASQVREHTPSQPPNSGSIHSPTKSEDLWTCRYCGWTYPNAHPSAKHRRNHKKHCAKHKGTEQGHSISYSNTSNETSSEDEGHESSEHDNGKLRLQNLNDIPSEHNTHLMSREIEYLESHTTAEFQAPPVEESQKIQDGGLLVQPQDHIGITTAKMADEKSDQHETFLEESTVMMDANVTREDDSKTLPNYTCEHVQDVKSETGDQSLQSRQMTEVHLSGVADKEWSVTGTSEKNKTHTPIVIENASVITNNAEDPSNKPLAGSKHEAPEDLWTCRYCGWTYPNSHPSAKHRRNHKKHCGKLKGFESTVLHKPANGSSDDASSSDESQLQGKLSGIGSQESLQKENAGMTLAAVTTAVLAERRGQDFSGEGLLQERATGSEKKEGFEKINGEIVSDDLHSGALQPLEKENVEATDKSLFATPQEDAHSKAEEYISTDFRNLETAVLVENPLQTSEKNSVENGDQIKEVEADIRAHILNDEHPYKQEKSESRSSQEVPTPQLWEQLLDADLERNKPGELEDSALHEVLPPNASEIQENKLDLSENTLPNVVQDDSHVVQPILPAPASFIPSGDTYSSEITAEPVQGDGLNSLLIQNTDAHSSQSLGSQILDGSGPRTLEQAQPIDNTAGAGTRKLEELPGDSNWAVFEPSQNPENSKTSSDARTEEQRQVRSADASSIEKDTMQIVDESHGNGKHHTSLQLLFSEDFKVNNSQSKQEEIVPSTDRSSPSSKGTPFVRKILGRVLSSSAELATSPKSAEEKPRTKPKWGIFVCCSAVN